MMQRTTESLASLPSSEWLWWGAKGAPAGPKLAREFALRACTTSNSSLACHTQSLGVERVVAIVRVRKNYGVSSIELQRSVTKRLHRLVVNRGYSIIFPNTNYCY